MIYNSKAPKNYFTYDELACSHCKESHFDKEFLNLCNWARHLSGVPFSVTSAYRCPEYNKSIGSKKDSSHPKGLGMDIMPKDTHHRFRIISALLTVGIKRIRIYPKKGHIHFDVDSDKGQEVFMVEG